MKRMPFSSYRIILYSFLLMLKLAILYRYYFNFELGNSMNEWKYTKQSIDSEWISRALF